MREEEARAGKRRLPFGGRADARPSPFPLAIHNFVVQQSFGEATSGFSSTPTGARPFLSVNKNGLENPFSVLVTLDFFKRQRFGNPKVAEPSRLCSFSGETPLPLLPFAKNSPRQSLEATHPCSRDR